MKKILLCIFINGVICFAKPDHIAFFAHGLAATKNQVRLFKKEYKKSSGAVIVNENYILDIPVVSFDFADSAHALESSVWLLPLRKLISRLLRGNYDYTSFGQQNEMILMHEVFTKKIPNNLKVIFSGISRGASIFFTWASQYQPSNIAAALLESPYGSIADIVNFKRKQFGIEYIISEDSGQAIMEFLFRKYDRAGIKPIDCIPFINTNIPILIIASISDVLVPWQSSFFLFQKLKEAGHNKVHFLLLKSGKHGFLLCGPEGKKYQKVVHAFYKHYDLPCDEFLACEGKELFLHLI